MERSVLVVEDDSSIQALLEAVMRHDNSECTLVRDGQSALAEISRRNYSAIVLDLLLPGMNGFEVLRHLKITRPELLARTIVITAAAESTLRDCKELKSVRRVLRKPLDIGELCSEIHNCAGAASSAVLRGDGRSGGHA